MGIYSKILGVAGALVLVTSAAVSAASLSVLGGTGITVPTNFDPAPVTPVSPGDAATKFKASVNGGSIGGGLVLNAVGKTLVTVTYLGKSAAAENWFLETIGGQFLDNKLSAVGSSISFVQTAGYLDFAFKTNAFNPTGVITNGGTATSKGLSMAFTHVTGNSAIALFDDAAGRDSGGDRDLDDMVVSINVQSVPLPAGGFLLLGGLGGLFAARRRKV